MDDVGSCWILDPGSSLDVAGIHFFTDVFRVNTCPNIDRLQSTKTSVLETKTEGPRARRRAGAGVAAKMNRIDREVNRWVCIEIP